MFAVFILSKLNNSINKKNPIKCINIYQDIYMKIYNHTIKKIQIFHNCKYVKIIFDPLQHFLIVLFLKRINSMKTFSFQLSIDIGNEVREQNKFLGEMVFEFYYVYLQ